MCSSDLYYEGREPDLVFQKSLNSIAKRHHVRLWRVTGPGGESIWLGAATHDITVGFDAKTFGLLHKIDENIDRERRKVIADLEFIGASSGASDLTRNLRVGAETKTDQVLAVARIDMPGDYALKSAPASAGGSRIRRFTRRLILEARQYALRENPYYLAFASVRKLTRQQAPVVEAGDFHSVLPSATAVDAVETAAE